VTDAGEATEIPSFPWQQKRDKDQNRKEEPIPTDGHLAPSYLATW
jgi:hypothetical protein